jgi:hypothetical protein
MNDESTRAKLFVARLLANPALQDLNPLVKEEQIIQFLHSNAGQLFPTLSSGQFFADRKWTEILNLLVRTLQAETNTGFLPRLEEMVARKLDFTFVSFLQSQRPPTTACEAEMLELLKRLLEKPEARRAFAAPFDAVFYGFVDRYLNSVYELKQYIYFELTKIQRLRMSKEEVKNMVKATLLLKPGIHLLTVGSTQRDRQATPGAVQPQFAEKARSALRHQLKLLPDALLSSAVNSNVSFLENRRIEATARLATLFAARTTKYRPLPKIDRGASSADKSWFSIARRNHKFYGFDINMLDELYKIAAENGW